MAEGHAGHRLGQLQREGLDLALVVGAPGVADRFVLQHVLVAAEVVEHAGLDELHLVRVDDLGRALDLLDVGVGVREKRQAAGVCAQVILDPVLPLVRQVLALGEVGDGGHEAEAGAVLDALGDALVLHVQQLQGGQQRGIVLAADVVLVQILADHAAAGQLDGGLLTVGEGVAQPGLAVDVDDLRLLRVHRVVAGDPVELVQHRHDEAGVLRVVDGGHLVHELRAGHEGVGPAFQHGLDALGVCAVDVGQQLAAVVGEGMDAGPGELHLIHAAVPVGKDGRVAVKHLEVAIDLLRHLGTLEKFFKYSHVSPHSFLSCSPIWSYHFWRTVRASMTATKPSIWVRGSILTGRILRVSSFCFIATLRK